MTDGYYQIGILVIALVSVSLLVVNDGNFKITVLGQENKTQTLIDSYEYKIKKINNPFLDSGICSFIGYQTDEGEYIPSHAGSIIPMYCFYKITDDSCDYVFLNESNLNNTNYCNIPSELEREGFISLAEHFKASQKLSEVREN